MEKITSLVKRLKNSAANQPTLARLTFSQGETFSWDYTACAITYNPLVDHAAAYLLHEFCHALLGHSHYQSDIDLLRIERAAWDQAQDLADVMRVTIPDDIIEDALDTYRDWLHDRSVCPRCEATGVETHPARHYICPSCQQRWTVNEARTCMLRRYPY